MHSIKKILSYLLLTSITIFLLFDSASAAGPMDATKPYDVLSRTKTGIATNHTIYLHHNGGGTATLNAANATNTFTVTFPSAWTGMSAIVLSDVTMTNVTTSSSITVNTVTVNTNVITIVIADTSLDAGDDIKISIGNTHLITNPSSGPYSIIVSGNAVGDANITMRVLIVDDDQVAVNATVDEVLNFSVAQSTVSFGTIVNTARWATNAGGSGTEAAASTLTAGTNANGGLVIAIRSAGSGGTGGLYSAGAGKLINATGPSTASGELYSFYSATVGSLTVLAGFLSGGTTALTTSDVTFANSGSAPIDDTNLNIFLKAQKIDTTPAGGYTDTLTLTCTATF